MNPTPILLWERLSSLSLRNDYPNSTKPEKKPLLPMTLPKNSWPPKQPGASILGKSEIRSDLRPLILDCTTLLGNSLSRDMVPSKLFRYYLLSLMNSNFLPHGKYTMYSTPHPYLLIAPRNHMVPPSRLHPLMLLRVVYQRLPGILLRLDRWYSRRDRHPSRLSEQRMKWWAS